MPQTFININGVSYDSSSIEKPTSRAFREAWVVNKNKIEVDMTVARNIQRNRIRQERTSRFEDLDAKYHKALEQKDSVKLTDLAFQRQALRDVTDDPRLDSVTTPEELEGLTLDVLLTQV